jgi:hypothetical protein
MSWGYTSRNVLMPGKAILRVEEMVFVTFFVSLRHIAKAVMADCIILLVEEVKMIQNCY